MPKTRSGFLDTIRIGPYYIYTVGETHQIAPGIGGLHQPYEDISRPNLGLRCRKRVTMFRIQQCGASQSEHFRTDRTHAQIQSDLSIREFFAGDRHLLPGEEIP